jgi:hypothetical protein
MTSMGDKMDQNMQVGLQPLVDGPLQAYTVADPVGGMKRLARATATNVALSAAGDSVFPVSASTHGSAHDEGRTVRLPTNFIVAVTPTSVYAFAWRSRYSKVRIKKELLRLPREGLKVKIRSKGTATYFGLVAEPTGTAFAFEMVTMGFAAAKAKVDQIVAALARETVPS